MALSSSSSPTTTAPGPEPDHPTPQGDTHEEVAEKGGGGDCHSPHHSFASPSPSPPSSPLRESDADAEKWEEDGWGAPASPSSSSPRPRNNASRRDPRKAELFRRLGASCDAARLREAELLQPPPRPRSETEGPDTPAWPPNTASWRRLCYLESLGSNPAKNLLFPTEDTLSHHPSKKSRKMVPNKDDEQCHATEHSSGSMPNQIVPYDNDQVENHCSPAPSRKRGAAIVAYAVQCNKCQKWRFIPSKKKYEEIREKSIHVRFICEHTNQWKPGVTCHDPTDISQDNNKNWAIDKPGIPQPPPGWERIITIRSEGSTRFADVYYVPPAGKTLRSTADVAKYLEQNPQYAAGVQLSQFSFKIPAPLRQDYVRKRVPRSKTLQPEEVLPLASAPPIDELIASNMLISYKEADPAADMQQDQLLGTDKTSN